MGECDTLKVQIVHFKRQIEKQQNDILLRDEHYEKMSGQYDILERQYQILKKEYKILEKTKSIDPASDDEQQSSSSLFKKKKKKKKNKKNKGNNGGILEWLDDESDDDDITKFEKKSIKTWLKQRHGDWDKSPNHNNHWLILPEDKLAGKDKDIEDLNNTIKTLKLSLDSKNKEIGSYKQQIDEYKKSMSKNKDDYLLKKLDSKHV